MRMAPKESNKSFSCTTYICTFQCLSRLPWLHFHLHLKEGIRDFEVITEGCFDSTLHVLHGRCCIHFPPNFHRRPPSGFIRPRLVSHWPLNLFEMPCSSDFGCSNTLHQIYTWPCSDVFTPSKFSYCGILHYGESTYVNGMKIVHVSKLLRCYLHGLSHACFDGTNPWPEACKHLLNSFVDSRNEVYLLICLPNCISCNC